MEQIGKALVVLAAILGVAGGLLLLAAKLNLPLGRLPGDFSWSKGGVRIWAPIGTSILLSVLLTVVLNVLIRRR